MNGRHSARSYAIAAGIATVAILAALPASRWMLSAQARLVTGTLPLADPLQMNGVVSVADSGQSYARTEEREKALSAQQAREYEAALTQPNNLPLHLVATPPHPVAFTVSGTRGQEDVSTEHARRTAWLLELEKRFNDAPELQAAILRQSCMQGLFHHREDLYTPPAGTGRRYADPPAPELLARMERAAERGALRDPDNAFFPLMSAVASFAANRDAEGRAYLAAAAARPRWDDYVRTEITGARDLLEASSGHAGAIPLLGRAYGVLLPHYAQIRNAVRIAAEQAAAAERAGHIDEGTEIRRDLMRVGSRIRTDSSLIVGSLVGAMIADLAASRPGGAPSLGLDDGDMATQTRAQFAPYIDYLRAHGRERDARDAERVRDANLALYRIQGAFPSSAPLPHAASLLRLWQIDMALLSNALWLFGLGGAAFLLGQTRVIHAGEPLPAAVRKGITAATLLPLAGGTASLGWYTFHHSASLGSPVICAIALLGIPVLLWRVWPARGERWRWVATVAASLLVAAGLAVLAYLQIARTWEPAHVWAAALGVVLPTPLLYLTGIALPLLTVAFLAPASLRLRIPLATGLCRGLAGLSAPLACLLLLAYAPVAVATLHYENRVHDTLRRITTHEGRYLAERKGLPWPGAVD